MALRISFIVLLAALAACSSSLPNEPHLSDGSEGALAPCPQSDKRPRGDAPRLLIQDGHSGVVNAMALSGDGRLLASAGMDDTLRLWDTGTGLLLDRRTAPLATFGVSLDHHGKRLAYAVGEAAEAKPHSVAVVELASSRRIQIRGRGPFTLSPDGSLLAFAHRKLELIDTKSGKSLRAVPLELENDRDATAIAFDAAAKRVVVALPGALVEVGVGPDAKATRKPIGDPNDLNGWVSDVVPVDKGVIIRRAANTIELVKHDGTIAKLLDDAGMLAPSATRLWSAVKGERDYSRGMPDEDAGHFLRAIGFDGKETLRMPLEREPFRVAAAAGGDMVAVSYFDAVRGNALQLIDPKSKNTLHTIEGRFSGVDSLAISGDGKTLAVGSLAALASWRLPSAELWLSTQDRRLRGARALSYDAKGRQLASIEAGRVRVRSATTGRLLRAFRHPLGQPSMLAFRAGTSELVTGDDLSGELHRWDLEKLPAESPLDTDNLTGDHERPRGEVITKLDFRIEGGVLDARGKLAAIRGTCVGGFGDCKGEKGQLVGKLALVDLDQGKVSWTIDTKTRNAHVAFSPDSQRILMSAYRDEPLEVGKSGTPILRAVDARSGETIAEVVTKDAGVVAASGDTIALGGTAPALHAARDLAPRHELALPDTRYTAVLADPTRELFYFGGAAGSTALVDHQGRTHALLLGTPGGDWIATTPDGLYRASVDGAHRIAWSYTRPLEAFSFEQFAQEFEQPALLEKRIATLTSPAAAQLPRARPPRIDALSVEGGTTTGAKRATLTASVSDDGLVSHVRAYVNGRLAAQERVCTPKAKVRVDVPLGPGQNRVVLVAHDPDGLASHARTVDVRSTAAADRPTLWVVAIGVSRYKKLAPRYQLEFADDDARAIAAAFGKLAGKDQPFSRARIQTLVDADVSVDGVKRALGTLTKMAPGDLAVVFLAGHGVRLGDGKMRFLTHDAALTSKSATDAGIGWSELERTLDGAAGRVLLLLDACHSGHVITDVVAPNEALAKALAARGRAGAVVFAASRGSQLSYEVGNRSGSSRALELVYGGEPPPEAKKLAPGHGLFTSALLEALAGKAPDRDKSGVLELDELIGHVSERVRVASDGRQTPWVARRELFGDFALVPLK
jgi:WD40 repeat protein